MNPIRFPSPLRQIWTSLFGTGLPPDPRTPGDHFVLADGKKSISHSKRILIVDDDVTVIRAMVRGFGRALGLQNEDIFLAHNLESACKVFAENQETIQAVITDVCMPEEGAGLRLHSFIREKSREVPIAIMSGGMNETSRERLNQILRDDPRSRFYEKPISDIQQIADWIKSHWVEVPQE